MLGDCVDLVGIQYAIFFEKEEKGIGNTGLRSVSGFAQRGKEVLAQLAINEREICAFLNWSS